MQATDPKPRVIPIRTESLFQVEPAHTIHARAAKGRFTRLRWLMVWLTQAVFYGLPWLTLDGQPALLFDLEARRFFLFGAVLYPQDMIYLTALLVASALALFLATTLAGRVWCGFSCPQTVYTEIFTWIEQRFEGDRLARIRLDAAPWSAHKLARRGGKHLAWGALGLWTGFTLVGYFTPIRSLALAVPAGALGPWEIFWTLFYGLATYGNAGFLREKVCQHMCPYGRFQGAMLDAHTLNVSYDSQRGEPRGARSRQADAAQLGLGSCVDCTLCVQVCPVGIDIRQGLQAACINCGACVDACDMVMDKLGQARGLIRFASVHELAQPAQRLSSAAKLALHLRRPRVWLYAGLLTLSAGMLAMGLWQRPTLRLDAMRDRSLLAREVEEGQVENLYRVLVMNASNDSRRVRLAVNGVPGLLMLEPASPVWLAPAAAQAVTVRLRLPAEAAQALRGQILPIVFTLQQAPGSPPEAPAQAGSTFVLPR